MKLPICVLAEESRFERRLCMDDPKARYSVKLAESEAEVAEAQRLRFQVFNLELNQGLAGSYLHGRDEDLFDPACDHLLVRERETQLLVGTYRLQTGPAARRRHDYYSASEFDLSPFEPLRRETVEVGRACIHAGHRNTRVLVLLWRGIAAYLVMHRARYVLGCSSLASQNEAEGLSLFEALKSAHFAPADFRTSPWPDHQCRRPAVLPDPPRVPGLFGAYLSLGAFVAAEPAIDRVFGTIDFLTFLDLRCLDRRAAHAYLGSPWAELLTEFAEP